MVGEVLRAGGEGERIYIRLPNWVGDVVMAEPFLRAVRLACPRAIIDVHGRAHCFGFIAGCGHFDEAIPLMRSRGPLWPIREGRRLRHMRRRYALAFVLPNSLSSAIIARLIRARRRLGYGLNGRSLLLTDALPVLREGGLRSVAMVDYYLGLAERAGIATAELSRIPCLTASPEQRAAAQATLHSLGIQDGEELWAINAGGAWLTKRWTPEGVADLAERIAEAGARPLLLGGPDEAEFYREVQSRLPAGLAPGMPDQCIPLDQLAPVLERCRILVTTDSGPRHFGVAARIPTLALHGPTHPGYTAVPFEATDIVCKEVDCWPCHKKTCPEKDARFHQCMRGIRAVDVLEAARALLDRCAKDI